MAAAASHHEEISHPFHWHYADMDDKNFQVHGRSLLFIIIIFSLLLILCLLCLYARWLYRYRRSSLSFPTTTATAMATINTTLLPDPPSGDPLSGLDQDTINSFPVILHHSDDPNSAETQCSICLSVLQDEEKVKVLPGCNHCYHLECVDKWLSTQSSCPLCRASLVVKKSLPEAITLP
ncbi:hypothetical protein MKX03_028682 [Papaver bracteatum]|nr:hypothetical protein MKX03_028682 [Papaver bracteatum]